MTLAEKTNNFDEVEILLEEKYQRLSLIEYIVFQKIEYIVFQKDKLIISFVYNKPDILGGSFVLKVVDRGIEICRSLNITFKRHYENSTIDKNTRRIKNIIKNSDTIVSIIVRTLELNEVFAESYGGNHIVKNSIEFTMQTITIKTRQVSVRGNFVYPNRTLDIFTIHCFLISISGLVYNEFVKKTNYEIGEFVLDKASNSIFYNNTKEEYKNCGNFLCGKKENI